MTQFDYDIGVIGGGAAGLTAASGAAQLGARTLLVEKEKELGGDCLHFGCVPSKTLIKSANVYHQMKHADKYGLPGIDIPPVDFSGVADRVRSVIAVIQHHDSVERFCELGAKVEFGEAVFSDEHTIRLNGKPITAKNWLIASGSSPAVPPIPGLKETFYITNRELFSLNRLPGTLIIMGGGPIGIEMAQAFNRFGSQVHVIEMFGQILPKEDLEMAEAVMQVLTDEGVKFHLNSKVIGAREVLGGEKEIDIQKADGTIASIRGDTLLVSVGRVPNVRELGLDTVGVEVSRTGLVVDNRLRTRHKHIYGAGDVIGGYQFTHAAGYEGSIVVSNAIFHLPRKVDYTFLPWATYTDPELASIGMNEKRAQEAGISYSVYTEAFKSNDRSLAEGETTGKIKMILDHRDAPIGVQILGPRASDLINEWVALLNGKVKLSTLAAAIHPYPTLGEINKKVAGTYFAPKIFSDKVKKVLKLFFNFKGRACGESSS